jgi:ribonucleoside-diphosphate reductase beta chain
MSGFNKNNTGHTKGYPLFLGDDLGIIDTINVQYPELEELYQLQVSQQWNEFEVDLTQDRMDMLTVPKGTTELMKTTIMWQTAADSMAAKSILESLGKYITNSECLNLATIWSFFEVIHARTYSHIIKQTFAEPNDMIEELYNNVAVNDRLEVIRQTFENIDNMPENASDFTKRCLILETLTAILGLESIAFMCSFAVTFGITETDVFQGIGQLVKLICRDEVLHTRMAFAILKILFNDPEWQEAITATIPSRQAILDSMVQQEMAFAVSLFSDDRKVIGLNAQLLKDYAVYMAKPVYQSQKLTFGLAIISNVSANPLPYMESYIDSSKVQAAAQEIQLTNYNIGVIADDNLDDLDLS